MSGRPGKGGGRVVLLGAGELASGCALRLHRAGFPLLLTEIGAPLAVRRLTSFSEAVFEGVASVEGATARRVSSLAEAEEARRRGEIPLVVDPEGRLWPGWEPDALVDGRMKKGGHGLTRAAAPRVVGLGPGFSAGGDCHFAVETARGPDLGRVIARGPTAPDTAIPGEVGGETGRRLLRAPSGGCFAPRVRIGERVRRGDSIGRVGEEPIVVEIAGVVRGLLRSGSTTLPGQKVGDIDPRRGVDPCAVSDKALAVSGGVLEALLRPTPR